MGWRGPCLLLDPETTLVLCSPTLADRVRQSIFLPLEPSAWDTGKWLWALPDAKPQGQEDAKRALFLLGMLLEQDTVVEKGWS